MLRHASNRQVGLAHRQRQLPEIVAIERNDIELELCEEHGGAFDNPVSRRCADPKTSMKAIFRIM